MWCRFPVFHSRPQLLVECDAAAAGFPESVLPVYFGEILRRGRSPGIYSRLLAGGRPFRLAAIAKFVTHRGLSCS
jgi:hypothetical protein